MRGAGAHRTEQSTGSAWVDGSRDAGAHREAASCWVIVAALMLIELSACELICCKLEIELQVRMDGGEAEELPW